MGKAEPVGDHSGSRVIKMIISLSILLDFQTELSDTIQSARENSRLLFRDHEVIFNELQKPNSPKKQIEHQAS